MRFDPLKTTQAASVVLQRHGGSASRLRLLKILVIADREALTETLEPITADRMAAMDHGPVLSQTYDMLKGTSFHSALWNHCIAQEGPQGHRLTNDPGVSHLSRYEIEKLQEVCDRFRNSNDYDLAHYTHTFPEWIKNQPPERSSRPISLDDLLEALNMTDQADLIREDIREETELDRIFGVARG